MVLFHPTPKERGYRLPAEWEPHEATWLSFPHDPRTWPGRLPEVERSFFEMIRALHPHERVELLVPDPKTSERVRKTLESEGVEIVEEREPRGVRISTIPTCDSWIRDYGPTFLLPTRGRGPLLAIDWDFNSWGGKYEELLPDDRVPERILPLLPEGTELLSPGIVLEGGSIDSNGEGTILTTESCLLNPNRNPHLSRSAIELHLREYLSAKEIVWLKGGVEGDDTDGHVDDVARFVSPTDVVVVTSGDPPRQDGDSLEENLRRLESFKEEKGGRIKIHPLPRPPPLFHEGSPLPASYANFYIGNRVVLVPVFGVPEDDVALEILGKLLPGRRAVPIPSEALVVGMGAVHCLTHEEPKLPGSERSTPLPTR